MWGKNSAKCNNAPTFYCFLVVAFLVDLKSHHVVSSFSRKGKISVYIDLALPQSECIPYTYFFGHMGCDDGMLILLFS